MPDALVRPLPFQAPPVTPPPSGELSASFLRDGPHRAPAAPPTMPRPGEMFHGFQLVEELGRGSFARVFLAKQDSLGGRLVAVKVTFRPTREAERLAKLQHTNVVPVYSVHDAPPVQVICMPFLGRRTIADVLASHRRSHPPTGLSTQRATRAQKGSTTLPGRRGPRSYPAPRSVVTTPAAAAPAPAPTPDASFIRDPAAVLRLLSQLADGLAHAHARNILHLDLKPGNVLLADTGEPMLLDFNLSFDTTRPDRELVGGTVPYMAPEQIADLRSRGNGGVDARTDLYSLGVMAYEMLTGAAPFASSSQSLADYDALLADRLKGPPPLRAANPAVSPAVESIVRKLLVPAPADRYQSAADLKDDLDRQLSDRPLKFAADRSVKERAGKWRRRNPRLLVGMAVALVLTLAGASGAYAVRESNARSEAEAVNLARATRDGLQATRLDLIIPGDLGARARGTIRAIETLQAYGLPGDPAWRTRDGFRYLPDADRAVVAGDLGELALLLANTRWTRGAGQDGRDRQTAAADVIRYLDAAADCFRDGTPPPLLGRLRAEITGQGVLASGPATARDHFLDAASLAGQNRFASAVPYLEAVVVEQPDHAAGQFLLAYCRQQLGQFERASERYEVAGALLPGDYRPPLYRGYTASRRGKPGEAEAAFTHALTLAPDQSGIYWERGAARVRQGKYAGAEHDLTQAIARGASPLRAHLLRADVRDASGNPAGAAEDRAAALTIPPVSEGDYLERGQFRLSGDAEGALADFRAAGALNPSSRTPLIAQIDLLSNRGRDAAALDVADRTVAMFPEDAELRARGALLLARVGRRDEAHREAELARKLSTDPVTTFTLGRTYARTARTHPADAETAIALLRRAYRAGYTNPTILQTEHDLDGIRDVPAFGVLRSAVDELFR